MIRLIRQSKIHFSTEKSKGINKPIVDYTQRGQYRSPLNLKVGDKISTFQVIKRSKLLDFQIDLAVMKCNQYGTQWIHFDCEQQKNSLGFVIKCNEAPQIIKLSIEKLLQCGSKKYPVRNPIEFMTRRSFNPENFSYSTNEYIFYGYQTSLLRDHSNLMDVFMHMMHSPLLRQEDFRDIVWRYQLRNGQKLQIEGDIVNEVKSLWNTSQIKIFDAIQKHILGRQGFPDPLTITKLQFEEMVTWHKKIFHPRNMIIITHGDLHPAKMIDKYSKLCEQLGFQQKYPLITEGNRPPQKFFNLEQTKTLKIEHLESNVPFVLSFKINNISSTQRLLLSILSQILFDMPNSIFMNWNSPQTPYPKHYGFQGRYFNIGVTMVEKERKMGEQEFLNQEKIIRDSLLKLYNEKIKNNQIEECLFHLEDAYFSKDGINIMTGCIDNILEQGIQSIEECFNVKYFISRVLRTYRKQNTFQELLKKHIIQNNNYIRILGKVNHDLIQDNLFQQQVKLRLIRDNLNEKAIEQIRSYRPPQLLQDYRVLPKIDVNQYQIFEQKNPNVFQIQDIPIYHIHKCDGVKITFRFDITDIQQEDVKLIPLICQAFPWMGGKGISNEAFRNHVQMYIRNISMKFQTNRTPDGMKMFLFFTLQFSDRNSQFGFNLCNHLINGHDHENIEALSQRLQKKGSEIFNQLSQNLIQIHGQHIGGTRSPHAMMEDPLFSARSICGLASDVLKISNPKQILRQVAFEMKKVTTKFQQKQRISILFECKNSNLQKYRKYIEIMLNPLKLAGVKFDPINDKLFTPSPILKYFPNYQEEFVFEAFSVPYYNNLKEIPTAIVLSSVINQNIKRLNTVGGSFIFKGALISYLRGSRKKILQLQQYYKKIEDIDEAKRSIFQQFRRYTAADLFYTGIMVDEARVLKQAVALVDEESIRNCLEKYLLKDIKEGKSSVLALGPNLGSYQPLIKKGWVIQRSIQQMSLRMESESLSTPKIEMSKYINIY